MLVCPTCGWKNPRKDYYEKHLLIHEGVNPTELVQEPVLPPVEATPTPELIVEDPVKVEPTVETLPVGTESPTLVESAKPVEVTPDPVQMVSDEITLKFTKPVEITINAKQYFGKEVKVKDMSTAAEIVRIAREAYGPGIMV